MTTPQGLVLRLVGKPAWSFRGERVNMPARDDTRRLSAYLLLSEGKVSRGTIASDLWPDSTSSIARRRLRNHLHLLRQHLRSVAGSDRCVGSARDRIWWTVGDWVRSDVAKLREVHQLLSPSGVGSNGLKDTQLHNIQVLLETCRGEVLPGWRDPWLTLPRLNIDGQRKAILRRLLIERIRRGSEDHLPVLSDMLLDLDSCDELAHWVKLWLAAQSPDSASIAHRWEVCVASYRNELATVPSRYLEALHEQLLRSGRQPLAAVFEHLPVDGRPEDTDREGGSSGPVRPPVVRDPLIGRAAVLKLLRRALREGRLVTLVGPGGVGKTRLAQAAAALRWRAAPEAVWVDLGAIADPEMVEQTVARALVGGVRRITDAREAILQEIAANDWLIILDNCEHVTAGVVPIAELLLEGAASGRLLVTSRQRLGVANESVVTVPPLAVEPEQSGQPSAAALLFCERGGLRSEWRALGTEDREAIDSICRLVDGLPLAVELAAARTGVLSIPQIEQGMRRMFGTLMTEARDRAARHLSLWGAIDWSWRLLEPDEQHVLAHVAVFRGGFWLDGLAEVLDGPTELDAGGKIETLVAHSLVQVDEERTRLGERRFRVLEPIRRFAQIKLRALGLERSAATAHSELLADLAEHAAEKLMLHDRGKWMDRLDQDRDNVREAMRVSERLGQTVTAHRLAASLGSYWYARGLFGWEREWLERVLLEEDIDDPAVFAGALLSAGRQSYGAGDLSAALEYCRRSVEIRDSLQLPRQHGRALVSTATVLAAMGRLGQAKQLAVNALSTFRKHDDSAAALEALAILSQVAHRQGDYDSAVALAKEALVTQRDMDAPFAPLFGSLLNLAWVAMGMGELSEATEWLDEAAHVAAQTTNRPSVSAVTLSRAELATWKGQLKQSRALHKAALAIAQDLQDAAGEATVLCNMATLELAERRFDVAALLLRRSEQGFRAVGLDNYIPYVTIRRAWMEAFGNPRDLEQVQQQLLAHLEEELPASIRSALHGAMAAIALSTGRFHDAAGQLRASFAIQREARERFWFCFNVDIAAMLFCQTARPHTGVALAGLADNIRAAMQATRWPLMTVALELSRSSSTSERLEDNSIHDTLPELPTDWLQACDSIRDLLDHR